MRAFGKLSRAFFTLPQGVLAASTRMLAASTMLFFSVAAAGDNVDPSVIVLRSRVFDIPFEMNGASKAKSVRLYMSPDRGKSWELVVEKSVPITQFHFEATVDGEFWFAHTTDLDTITDLVSQLSPERKISVDSAGPEIHLAGSAGLDGKLAATLILTDSHQIATLRVLYATDVVRRWNTVANALIDAEGKFSIEPSEDWQQMSVHITATDSAGNGSVQAKTFRRPRIATIEGPRLAAQSNPSASPDALRTDALDTDALGAIPSLETSDPQLPNQLRVRTVAGPGDPPKFMLGMMPATPAESINPYALQSPGAGPVNPSRPNPAPASSNHQDFNRPLNSFGLGFRDVPDGPPGTPAARARPPQTTPQTPSTANTSTTQPAPRRPQTLPSAGLAAMVTPSGVEVLPAPKPDANTSSPATAPETLFTPTPKQIAPAEAANNSLLNNSLLAPTNTVNRLPGDPITKSIPAPAADSATEKKSNRMRTLSEAMRPITPNPYVNNPSKEKPTTPRRTPEVIPAPAPSQSPEDTRRYRAERAEQRSREQQLQYDRAQLARTVAFRYSNSNRFSLEYELQAVGASGVESVELYGSIDAGRSWKHWGADPDRSSPFDIETKGEGIFSFRIVVLGNNGLRSPRPLPGDDPDIAVVVDQTIPQIRITSARYGEGDRTGSLIIRYECTDENLMSRPVTIAFSRSMDGPWTTIAAGLRNDGLYVWPADPKLPPAIYLRVDAKDQAGNTGSYLLDQPIATGGLAPRARILGFRSR